MRVSAAPFAGHAIGGPPAAAHVRDAELRGSKQTGGSERDLENQPHANTGKNQPENTGKRVSEFKGDAAGTLRQAASSGAGMSQFQRAGVSLSHKT